LEGFILKGEPDVHRIPGSIHAGELQAAMGTGTTAEQMGRICAVAEKHVPTPSPFSTHDTIKAMSLLYKVDVIASVIALELANPELAKSEHAKKELAPFLLNQKKEIEHNLLAVHGETLPKSTRQLLDNLLPSWAIELAGARAPPKLTFLPGYRPSDLLATKDAFQHAFQRDYERNRATQILLMHLLALDEFHEKHVPIGGVNPADGMEIGERRQAIVLALAEVAVNVNFYARVTENLLNMESPDREKIYCAVTKILSGVQHKDAITYAYLALTAATEFGYSDEKTRLAVLITLSKLEHGGLRELNKLLARPPQDMSHSSRDYLIDAVILLSHLDLSGSVWALRTFTDKLGRDDITNEAFSRLINHNTQGLGNQTKKKKELWRELKPLLKDEGAGWFSRLRIKSRLMSAKPISDREMAKTAIIAMGKTERWDNRSQQAISAIRRKQGAGKQQA
jgi:hypothetical protein